MGPGARRRRVLAALGAAASLAVTARAAEPAGPGPAPRPADAQPETVTFAAVWPGDLDVEVTYDRRKTQTGRPTQVLHLTGRLTAARRGDGLVVRQGRWAGGPPEAAALLRAVDALALVVGPGGEVEGVEGVAAAVAGMRKTPPFDQATPRLEEALKLVGPGLEKELREQWSLLVALWAGRALELGAEYEVASTVPVAALPAEAVRLQMRLEAVRRLECPPPRAAACVEVRFTSRADPEDVRRIAVALMERLGVPGDQLERYLGELRMESAARLVTEPATLLPHELEVTKTTRSSGADAAALERVDVQRWVYRHAARAPTSP